MKFTTPLIRGRLVQRYKRFLFDARLDDGTAITGTCANTGSLMGLKDAGTVIWMSEHDGPTRKYAHVWELCEVDLGAGPSIVGINTSHPNRLVAEAIETGGIAELAGYGSLRREVKYGKNSRIDILLEDEARGRAYVEIKNVHMMRRHGFAEFPDSITARGAKHLAELSDMVADGHRAVMVYLIQRTDAESLSLARDVDPTYGKAFDAAVKAGVECLAYDCRMSPEEITVDKRVPIKP